MRQLSLLIALLVVSTTVAADDFKIIKLEQDVRNLERQVSELSRQLRSLEQQRVPSRESTSISPPAAPAMDDERWLDSHNWNLVRTGMAELDVVRVLGKPTSMRVDADETRTLLYAMEIGSAGFLGGNVQLRDRQVVAVNRPVLR